MPEQQSQCEYLDVCPFFQETLEGMPSTVNLIKQRYCLSDYKRCARYRVTVEVGAQYVADSLFPKNSEEAEAVIKAVKH